MAERVATLEANLLNLERLNNERHKENVEAIKMMSKTITNLRLSNARWSVVAGVVTAVCIKLIDKFIK
jgi:hypothetical protein